MIMEKLLLSIDKFHFQLEKKIFNGPTNEKGNH